ncbi:hypothetical protein SB6408_02179 [Klebsiella spallanzanii]|uniref:Suppression of copper sensitivity: copper binding protein ScsA n=2 Tax=Klebsiella spallanzanii TaxID=2587528 RepID=A0A564NDR6_9ENTR|nr:hypothetical protein SB6408_02179 [Klebsiella spallanzanii]
MTWYPMHNRQLPGKWFLILTCLVMAICLVQRAVYLHHFLEDASRQAQGPTISLLSPQPSEGAEQGPSPCQLSAKSLLCAQPLFFDGALPAVIIFLALLQLFAAVRIFIFRDDPVWPPTLRIHLKNCVFRE